MKEVEKSTSFNAFIRKKLKEGNIRGNTTPNNRSKDWPPNPNATAFLLALNVSCNCRQRKE
ncbi:MAG: hypothetical protein L6246_09665 [Thermodesulfovibrionales bacterium]|nr:hypothetical protein [Thermodesulfovibrionales bacterium]